MGSPQRRLLRTLGLGETRERVEAGPSGRLGPLLLPTDVRRATGMGAGGPREPASWPRRPPDPSLDSPPTHRAGIPRVGTAAVSAVGGGVSGDASWAGWPKAWLRPR